MDLRERVVVTVEREGLPRCEAAMRFGVATSGAIKWVLRFRGAGRLADTRRRRGKQREWLMERTVRDFTLRGLVAELAQRS